MSKHAYSEEILQFKSTNPRLTTANPPNMTTPVSLSSGERAVISKPTVQQQETKSADLANALDDQCTVVSSGLWCRRVDEEDKVRKQLSY